MSSTDGITTPAGQSNPANPAGQLAATAASPPATRRRIPLSVPRRKLEVDPIPGFVLYWFLETNVAAAIEGGYEFVDRREVRLSQQGQASSSDDSGNTDLGSRVSVLGNKEGENGRPEHLLLMKIREDWWYEDRKHLDDRNAAIIQAIFGNGQVMGSELSDPRDQGLTYIRQAQIQGSGRLLNRGLKKVT